MPPPGHEPFLGAICASPEDDTVRLVYADWLDENGDPARAEFIRLQVAQAGQPRLYDKPYFRAEALREQHGPRWLGELPTFDGGRWDDTFRRGFIDGVRVSGEALLAHHRAIFAATPVQALTLSNAGDQMLADVLSLPGIERLTELYLDRCLMSRNRFRVLAHCPTLKSLRTLGVRGRIVIVGPWPRPSLTNREARQLAETPHLPSLQEVYFDGPLSDEAAAMLKARFTTVRHAGSCR